MIQINLKFILSLRCVFSGCTVTSGCNGKYTTLTVNMSEGTGVNLRIWMNEKKEGRWPS